MEEGDDGETILRRVDDGAGQVDVIDESVAAGEARDMARTRAV